MVVKEILLKHLHPIQTYLIGILQCLLKIVCVLTQTHQIWYFFGCHTSVIFNFWSDECPKNKIM